MLLFKILFSKKISFENGVVIRKKSSEDYIITYKYSDLYHHVKINFNKPIFLLSITVYKGLLSKPIYNFNEEIKLSIPNVFLPYSLSSVIKTISKEDIFKALNTKNIYKILKNINHNLFQIYFTFLDKNFFIFKNKNSCNFFSSYSLDIEQHINNSILLCTNILYSSDIFEIIELDDVVINSYLPFKNYYILGKNKESHILFLNSKIIKSDSLEYLKNHIEDVFLKNIGFNQNLKTKMLAQNIINNDEKITKEHLNVFRLLNY